MMASTGICHCETGGTNYGSWSIILDVLLDLVITDIPQHVNANVHPKITDHAFIVATLSFKVPQRVEVEREFWQFNKADWKSLNNVFATNVTHNVTT